MRWNGSEAREVRSFNADLSPTSANKSTELKSCDLMI